MFRYGFRGFLIDIRYRFVGFERFQFEQFVFINLEREAADQFLAERIAVEPRVVEGIDEFLDIDRGFEKKPGARHILIGDAPSQGVFVAAPVVLIDVVIAIVQLLNLEAGFLGENTTAAILDPDFGASVEKCCDLLTAFIVDRAASFVAAPVAQFGKGA